jgi:hypothetical protein
MPHNYEVNYIFYLRKLSILHVIELKIVSTVLLKEDLEKLKEKTGAHEVKKALQIAVEHYLKCPRAP